MSEAQKYGCSCWGCIIVFFFLWTVFIGLPTPWGTLNLDIIPPAIRIEKGNP